jgi:hypothetical protein
VQNCSPEPGAIGPGTSPENFCSERHPWEAAPLSIGLDQDPRRAGKAFFRAMLGAVGAGLTVVSDSECGLPQ